MVDQFPLRDWPFHEYVGQSELVMLSLLDSSYASCQHASLAHSPNASSNLKLQHMQHLLPSIPHCICCILIFCLTSVHIKLRQTAGCCCRARKSNQPGNRERASSTQLHQSCVIIVLRCIMAARAFTLHCLDDKAIQCPVSEAVFWMH